MDVWWVTTGAAFLAAPQVVYSGGLRLKDSLMDVTLLLQSCPTRSERGADNAHLRHAYSWN